MAEFSLKQKPHIQQVDYIRAIASLAVALFHLGGKTLPILNFGWLGVYLFFLLSGFIICKAMPAVYTWKMSARFIIRRLIRIEPPYLISVMLAVIIKFLMVVNYKPDWVNVACHIAYLNNFTGKPYLSPVYWTLGIEFQFYIFVALCFPLIAGKAGNWFLLVLSIAAVFIRVQGSTLIGVFPVFALGMLYYRHIVKRQSIIYTLFFGFFIGVCTIYNAGWLPGSAAFFALIILILPLKPNPLVAFFSQISFSLYLTHDIIGSNLVVYLGTLLPKTFLFKGIEFITGIFVSVIFAWCFYRYVETPFLRLSKQVHYSN